MLLKQDFHTDTWRRMKKFINERLQDLREQNDQISLSLEKTAALRGEIAGLKRLLDLEEDNSSSSLTDVLPGFPGDDMSSESHSV